MKNKPEIKKVKIDEHINATKRKAIVETAIVRKRGRPRKDNVSDDRARKLQPAEGASTSPGAIDSRPIDQNKQPATIPAIQPIYDTTEEAKAFLRSPFDIAAGLTGIQKLALYPSQIDALAPSFKVVYDKRIAPYMGNNADLIAFGVCAAGIIFEKVQVFQQENNKKKDEPTQKESAASSPYIQTEHHV